MATFTMQLDEVLQVTSDIGLNDYPIFDPAYREGLNKKIIDHYYLQEIGRETVSQFRFSMRRKMNEIMPYYNQLYKSTQMEFDPLLTVDLSTLAENATTTDGESKSTGSSTESSESDSTSESKAAAVTSNFPQNRLAGNKDYATAGQDNVSASEAKSTGNGASSTTGAEQNTVNQDGTAKSATTGFQGNRSGLLQDYRATFLNVDMMVIADLDELFMQVWSNGDSYTRGSNYGIAYGW